MLARGTISDWYAPANSYWFVVTWTNLFVAYLFTSFLQYLSNGQQQLTYGNVPLVSLFVKPIILLIIYPVKAQIWESTSHLLQDNTFFNRCTFFLSALLFLLSRRPLFLFTELKVFKNSMIAIYLHPFLSSLWWLRRTNWRRRLTFRSMPHDFTFGQD